MYTDINDCEFGAMVDVAVDDPQGLSEIDDLRLAKSILSRVTHKLPFPDVLKRIVSSQFPVELVKYLPHMYGHSVAALEPIVKMLLEEKQKLSDEEGDQRLLDEDELVVFADVYHTIRIRGFINRGEYRRAYDAIKDAFKGFNPPDEHDSMDVPDHGRPESLAASRECLRSLVNELHTAMSEKNLLEEICTISNSEIVFNPGSGPSSPAGILFAVAIGGCTVTRDVHHSWMGRARFKIYGLQVIAIAKYLNKLSREARKARRERRVELASD